MPWIWGATHRTRAQPSLRAARLRPGLLISSDADATGLGTRAGEQVHLSSR